jgi:23S rRNA pseudouridine2605 synthase
VTPPAERLQKVLARAGLGSRRAIEALIAEGRVAVNGEIAELGRRVDPDKDVVEVDGSRVPLAVGLVHLMLNKPAGVVTTAQDPQGRPVVHDYVDRRERVWPVGRLDRDTSGALLLTNDGPLTQRLNHPRYEVPKTYLAEVAGASGRPAVRGLEGGVVLDDGPAAARVARLVERRRGSSLVEVTLTEGRNREVRRMLEAVGHPARRLVRVAIGPLMLGRLKEGTLRRLSSEEIRGLYRACGL